MPLYTNFLKDSPRSDSVLSSSMQPSKDRKRRSICVAGYTTVWDARMKAASGGINPGIVLRRREKNLVVDNVVRRDIEILMR